MIQCFICIYSYDSNIDTNYVIYKNVIKCNYVLINIVLTTIIIIIIHIKMYEY